MTMTCAGVSKYARAFVRSRGRQPRSDRELLEMFKAQARVMDAMERTRRNSGKSIAWFAFQAGVDERTYRRALSGVFLMRASTMAKLRVAQRRAAAGKL